MYTACFLVKICSQGVAGNHTFEVFVRGPRPTWFFSRGTPTWPCHGPPLQQDHHSCRAPLWAKLNTRVPKPKRGDRPASQSQGKIQKKIMAANIHSLKLT